MEQPDDVIAPPDASAPLPERPSKSQRKRDAHALQALGVQLVALPPARLARLELPEVLREAVMAAQGMHQRGARSRQMQYIGRLMRELEPAALTAVREALASGRGGSG